MHSSPEPLFSGAREDDVLYAIYYKAYHVLKHIIAFSGFLALLFEKIYFMYMGVLLAHISVYYVCAWYLQRSSVDPKRVLDPLELELQL